MIHDERDISVEEIHGQSEENQDPEENSQSKQLYVVTPQKEYVPQFCHVNGGIDRKTTVDRKVVKA